MIDKSVVNGDHGDHPIDDTGFGLEDIIPYALGAAGVGAGAAAYKHSKDKKNNEEINELIHSAMNNSMSKNDDRLVKDDVPISEQESAGQIERLEQIVDQIKKK